MRSQDKYRILERDSTDLSDEEVLGEMVALAGRFADIESQLADPEQGSDDSTWRSRARKARHHTVRRFAQLRAEAVIREFKHFPDINPEREEARAARLAKQEMRGQRLAAQQTIDNGPMARRARKEAERIERQERHNAMLALHAEQKREKLLANDLYKALYEIEQKKTKELDRKLQKAVEQLQMRAPELIARQTKSVIFLEAATLLLDKKQRTAIWDRAREMFPDSPVWTENVSKQL